MYLFVLAGVGFFLPFMTLSCSGQRLTTVTGIQLIAGTDMRSPQSPSRARVAFALGMCALGALLSLKASGTARGIPAALVGATGAIALLSFKTMSDDEVLRLGRGVIRVQYEFGYYLALGTLALAAVLGCWHRLTASMPLRRD